MPGGGSPRNLEVVPRVRADAGSLGQDALRARKFAIDSAELTMVPKNTVKVEGADAERILKLMEALEELDDVSRVSSNFDIDAAQLAEAEA